MTLRYDTADLSSPTRLDNGYLRADGYITRVGVFPYLLADGSIRNELRHPDEVFKADSLGSFDLVPLTNDHPPESLTATNTKKYSIGITSSPRRHDNMVAATVTVMDDDGIADIEGGKSELSCGYRCDLVMEKGVTKGIPGIPDGLRYDARQTNIRGNHLSLVKRGRAGPKVALRLDSDDGVIVEDADIAPQKTNTNKEPSMPKITVDGVDFEVSEQAQQAIAKLQARADAADAEVADIKKSLDKESARADAAEEARDKAVAERNDALSDEAVSKAVKARLDLERSARKALGAEKADELDLPKMDAADIRKAVVLHVSPSAKGKLEDCSEEYLRARFDAALESVPSEGIKLKKADTSEVKTDTKSAYERMVERNYKMGREPLGVK